MREDVADQPARGPSRGLAAYLTFVMGVGGYAVFALGVLAPYVLDDLDISRAQLGAVLTANLLAAIAAALYVGLLSDRLPAAVLSTVALMIAVGSLFGMATASNIVWLVAASTLYGVINGSAVPITNRLLADRVSPSRRARVMGVKASGVQLAAMLAGLGLPTLAAGIGWRLSLVLSAGVVLIGTSCSVAFWRPRRERRSDPPSVAIRATSETLVLRLAVYALLMGFAVSALAAYLVLYGVDALALPVWSAGLAPALLGLAGVVSRVAWAEVGQRRESLEMSLVALPIGGLIAVVLLWGAEGGPVWFFWLGAFVFGATAVAWNAIGNLLLINTERPSAGRDSGVMQAGFLTGYAIAPITVGLIIDTTGSYRSAWAIVGGTLALATVWIAVSTRINRAQNGTARHCHPSATDHSW